ncbi:uncharacterized protein LOC128165938 [Crassostrea angulata]|uniref:uncharacterized protein LOC128165938 n=1 Tax=Magallana angulata TaxID=2784310 RepID=UPI0022B13CDD|nr:uncharacterized protein LOC128165938 [Crassostrea angulata]
MTKRRIKRNFEEQFAVVSSLTVTPPKSTNDETKPKKTRNWSYNKVWRRGEAQEQENGRNPGGKPGKVLPVPPSQTEVTPVPPSQTKVKCGPPQTAHGWRYNRVWRRDRVWRRENFEEQFAVVSSLTVTPPKSTNDEIKPKKTRNWSYNKVWRRGEAQEQENGRNPGGKPGKVPPVPPSQNKVTPVLPSQDKVIPASPLKAKVTPVPPLQTKVKRDPPQTVLTSVNKSSASTTNTVPSAEMRVSDTAKTNSVSLTPVKTATSGTHELVSTTYDVYCKETQSDPLSGTEKTQGEARPNRCSSREDVVQSPADRWGMSSKDNAPDSPVAGDKKHLKESLKRKRCEPQTTISKRIMLEHSAAVSQLTSVSYRFLWSMETLFDGLCLVFEDFRL